MPNSLSSRSTWLLVIGIACLVLDQLTKYWAEHILGAGSVIPILPIFDLSLAHNYGAAFGFLNDAGGWQVVFFTSLAVIVSLALLYMINQLKPHEYQLKLAYTLIIAGALGNAIDRVVYGYVIDFIHWFYKDWHYPHFNVADSVILIGAVLMITEAFGITFLNDRDENTTR